MTIEIEPGLAIAESELEFSYIRAGGPGGQNVNKVASAAQLRFDARNSPSLTEAVKTRLLRIAGARATKDGEIVITANRFRTQEANRRDAIARLVEMIKAAAFTPRRRVATRPSFGARQERMESKSKRAGVKRLRGKIGGED